MGIEKEVENKINDYEAVRKEKRKEAQEKYEKELQKTREFYKEFAHFIADTALPIFKKVKTRIHNRGYPSKIETPVLTNKEISTDPITESIKIKISNIKNSELSANVESEFSTLELAANLPKESISRRRFIPHHAENSLEFLPIASCSEINVEEEINDFIEKVFSIPG